jgi:branched-chain amino acid transport system ATP-binding protein
MTSTLVETKALRAGYGSLPVLVDVNLRVAAGEMVALLGSNGAGKTTTLMTLAGALTPTSGTVNVFGQRAGPGVARRIRDGLAFLPERRAVFMGLTVRDNLRLGRGTIDAALSLFPELEKRMNVRAGLVSGGEQQMLSLARTIAAEPKVILADEISLGLAPMIVRRLLQALSGAAARGTGILIVEQHPSTALKWTDRAYVMRRGRIEMAGDSKDLLAQMDQVTDLYL